MLGGLLKFPPFWRHRRPAQWFSACNPLTPTRFFPLLRPGLPAKASFPAGDGPASVAQAAMIGKPGLHAPGFASWWRNMRLERADRAFSRFRFRNRTSWIPCSKPIATARGLHPRGESLAGLKKALADGLLRPGERAILDSTAHALKFAEFQNHYFQNTFGPEFEIKPHPN